MAKTAAMGISLFERYLVLHLALYILAGVLVWSHSTKANLTCSAPQVAVNDLAQLFNSTQRWFT